MCSEMATCSLDPTDFVFSLLIMAVDWMVNNLIALCTESIWSVQALCFIMHKIQANIKQTADDMSDLQLLLHL